ncbi:MAG: hypothetical protein SFU25_09675 [Candidatus Caenarcaniphilales bacterium]|nr:hypothetical protein [Candidatus Caenarcaniphilales bacterium]
MKHPIIAFSLIALLWFFLLTYDLLFGIKATPLFDLVQNLAFSGFGIAFGTMIGSAQKGNKKPDLIDSEKLAMQITKDEKKQLEEKVKTLELAIERLTK